MIDRLDIRGVACRVLVAAIVLVLCSSAVVTAQVEEDEEVEGPLRLPITFNKVWFREKKKKGLAKLKAFKHSGLLTITEDGLDFVGAKDSYFFPIEDVEMLSIGKLGKDVNTDWVVLSIRQQGTTRVVGLRDGHAWGYGTETLRIYRRLREAFELLGAGLYAQPPGYKTYDRLRHQIVLAYPEDWSAFVVRSVFVSEGAAYGRVVFSPREVESLADEMKDERSLPGIELGTELAVIFDRSETTGGMKCNALKPGAREAILARMARYPVLAEAATIVEPLSATEDPIAGCAGLRITARTRDAAGAESVIEARVFAKEGTLFTLGARVPEAHADEVNKILDVMAGSILMPLVYGGEF